MEEINICYVVIGLLILLYTIALVVTVKSAHKVDDDFEFINEDGDHIYYDRKLIEHKKREEKQ